MIWIVLGMTFIASHYAAFRFGGVTALQTYRKGLQSEHASLMVEQLRNAERLGLIVLSEKSENGGEEGRGTR